MNSVDPTVSAANDMVATIFGLVPYLALAVLAALSLGWVVARLLR